MNRQCPYGTLREPGVDCYWHQIPEWPCPATSSTSMTVTTSRLIMWGWNWRANEAKKALPIIVKDEAGRALLQATLSLASKGHLATVLL
jgi:hypothetical protein